MKVRLYRPFSGAALAAALPPTTISVAVLDRIAVSEEARACEEKGASESRRLAYVGMSRARVLLLMAGPKSAKTALGWS